MQIYIQAAATTSVVAKRDGIKIFINDDEKGAFDDLRESMGMMQKVAATRLFRWLLSQNREVQEAILLNRKHDVPLGIPPGKDQPRPRVNHK